MASSVDLLQLSDDFPIDPINPISFSSPTDELSPSLEIPKIYVVVPVATIGCGKTTIGKALNRLYGWPIIQNDDIPLDASDRKGLYIQTILRSLKSQYECSTRDGTSPLVVYAERNNHLPRERDQLIFDINSQLARYSASVKYICLLFDHSDVNRLNAITAPRVLGRGDNHKTVQKSVMGESAILDMMQGFQARFESRGLDGQFDSIINLFVRHPNSSRTNLDIVTRELSVKYPDLVPNRPTDLELDSAFEGTILEFEKAKQVLEQGYDNISNPAVSI
ncbi:tRNA ligase [Sugiyamaella lignohabitans]|uniref:tRNA ligase n=1 Tax=Sugiyamaella lignohabitans TaxID=796027 RepID=A0A167DY37_9ASCO|nr:tRNA ligase [Sugiyamaella lignohabitans]ANB13432.1 tRNA ligase [Sugiyamaella lignohabitans]